jgi:hypothetical protein
MWNVVAWAWLLVGVGLDSPRSAETNAARLDGSVSDPDGLPVPGAEVTALHQGTSARHRAVSDEVGLYHFLELPPGAYRLRVERAGFKTLLTKTVALAPGQSAQAPLVLDVGRLEERVVVEPRLAALQTDSAAVGGVITGYTASSLPLKGRNIAQLALLFPGTVTTAPGSMAQPKINSLGRPYVNGHREQGNSYVLDGVDMNEPIDNRLPYQPSPEALEEVQVETNNYSARHGHLAGAMIHASLKSGTDELRGSVFGLLRDQRLNARRWEDGRTSAPASSLAAPEVERNQQTVGGVIGGPIVARKLHFFADYQGILRDDGGANVPAGVVPPEWGGGDFSSLIGTQAIVDPLTGLPFPGNRIPEERIHPVARELLREPSLYLPADAAGLRSAIRRSRLQAHQGDLKLTWQPAPRDHAFLRVSHQSSSFMVRTDEWPSWLADDYQTRFTSGVLSWSRSFGLGGVSESRIGYTRMTYAQGFADWAGLGQRNVALGLDTSQAVPGLGYVGLGGQVALGNAVSSWEKGEEVYAANQRVSGLHGRHHLAAGLQWIHSRARNRESGTGGVLGYHTFGGEFTGLGFSDFLLGLVASKGRGGSPEPWVQLEHRVGAFVEDTIKVRPELTAVVGLRWSFISPLVETNDRQVNFDLATGRALYAGREGNSRGLYEPFYGGFEPRLALAWTPHRRLAVRAGYGIVHSMEGTGSYLRLPQNLRMFSETSASYGRGTGPGAFGFSDLRPPTTFAGAIRAYSPDLKPQLTQQWNLFLEYAPTPSMNLNVGYVGHKASRLVIPKDFNQPLPGDGPPETWLPAQQRRPLFQVLPEVTAVLGTASEGNSNYHGLQMMARQRSSAGLELLASYTWSKALSDNVGYYGGGWVEVADSGAYRQNAYDRRAEYGPAFFDARHNLAVSAVYEPQAFLQGWGLASLLTAHTGFPVTVIMGGGGPCGCGGSRQGTLGYERPDRVGSGRVASPSPDRWIDIDAFRTPAPGTFGNSGVGILRAPGYFNWDVALSRRLELSPRTRLTLKLQAFNVLNRPNLGPPGRDISDPASFGTVTTTIDGPRELELSLKLEF